MISEASATAGTIVCLAKKEGTMQYGYRKWGTHARVFVLQTLAHGNSKNEIDEETDEDGKKGGVCT